MYESEKAIFLGFAFHRQNIDLLYKLIAIWKNYWRQNNPTLSVVSNYYATFFQTSPDNVKETEKQLRRSNDQIKDIKICEKKYVDLFSEYSKALEKF